MCRHGRAGRVCLEDHRLFLVEWHALSAGVGKFCMVPGLRRRRRSIPVCVQPDGDEDGPHGSLAIVLTPSSTRLALRCRIYIKGPTGEFVQWDEIRHVQEGLPGQSFAHGPDVYWGHDPPASLGIFGLSHAELLRSEWVEDDTLTVKFELEVRPWGEPESEPLRPSVEISGSTICQDTQTLFQQGKWSDILFMVQGEVIQAHSQILCARSEVFSKQLTGGMQESVSKVIVVEDCDVATFRAFLQFLYTDRLPDVQELMPEGGNETESESQQQLRIQALLAVSHKYQVKRLQLWCEAKLSEDIDASHVCGILCQAHLLHAKHLENACLSFIKDHAGQVLTLPDYVELVKKWPQIGLKVHLFSVGVLDTEALASHDAC
ncbi:BPM1 [Symbiodinium sp. CCMP2456]|nr:BPM1 [Symbiodinium sp. CCMP2456]